MCRPAEAESEDNGEELSGGHSNYSADRKVEIAADVVLQLVVAALERSTSVQLTGQCQTITVLFIVSKWLRRGFLNDQLSFINSCTVIDCQSEHIL